MLLPAAARARLTNALPLCAAAYAQGAAVKEKGSATKGEVKHKHHKSTVKKGAVKVKAGKPPPSYNACAATTCLTNTKCVVKKGVAMCIPLKPKAICSGKKCAKHKTCKVKVRAGLVAPRTRACDSAASGALSAGCSHPAQKGKAKCVRKGHRRHHHHG